MQIILDESALYEYNWNDVLISEVSGDFEGLFRFPDYWKVTKFNMDNR